VLTADLVNARRRGNELRLTSLDADGRARAGAISERLIEAATRCVGRTREELDGVLGAIDVGAREHRLKDGLAKLVEDRCVFDAKEGLDPEEIRRDVFTRASAVRLALAPGARFDRDALLQDAARERSETIETIEGALFADLRGAHVLLSFEAPSAQTLVAAYEHGQAQAVLLRAVKVAVDVKVASPAALRGLFRRLKFLRLLHTITKTEDGHRIAIDGPFSLFESITKYGLQLALVLPALEACEAWTLAADVRWGKERVPLVFHLAGGASSGSLAEPALPDEIEALVQAFRLLESDWRISVNTKILELRGIGLTVPDLVFERRGGDKKVRDRIYLEVMGYWSRAAVWQRVELVQAGLAQKILFAVSSRLRVSEEVLDGELPGALYVYKGTMNARRIAEHLDRLAR
jgi:predicted nuclease of restriction endonuclease-like RecB superfamily